MAPRLVLALVLVLVLEVTGKPEDEKLRQTALPVQPPTFAQQMAADITLPPLPPARRSFAHVRSANGRGHHQHGRVRDHEAAPLSRHGSSDALLPRANLRPPTPALRRSLRERSSALWRS